jgi:glycerophosphoryl diester phosphodiesterase
MEYIAHRGKTQEALENTTKAFEHAGQDDHFVGIECDIHSTLDGIFVVHHDDSIKNLNNDNRKIIDMDFHEIKDIKLEGKYDIPTLETFLEICKTYKKIPMIEIKKVANIEHYFLTTEITDQNMYDCRVNELNYYINKESLNGQTIKVLKSKGFKIGVFTVNEKEIEEQAKKLSLNYLTTDSL